MNRINNILRENKPTVLIVDDEEINNDILSFMLGDDYNILNAFNGLEALDILMKNKVSIVLLDLMMPVMDGFTFLKKQKEISSIKDIPVIVLTSESKLEVEALNLGAMDFIKKPYESSEIIKARVNRIIDLYQNISLVKNTSSDELTGLMHIEYFNLFASNMSLEDMDMVVIKIVNEDLLMDLYGHNVVIKTIKDLGRYLLDYVSSNRGLATRTEGDKFYLYQQHIDDYDKLYNDIYHALNNNEVYEMLRIKIGVYPHVDTSLGIKEMMRYAESSLNEISTDARTNINYYDDQMRERAIFNEKLVLGFEDALKNRELTVYYQPKYYIQGDKPVLGGAEALVRWNSKELGFISPGVFIPIFEANGLINKLDQYIFHHVLSDINEFKSLGLKTPPISVNLSRLDLYNPHLISIILELLKEENINSSDIHLEVLESGFMESTDQIVEVVTHLKEHGFVIEIDDFGSGHSSLNTITRLPFDILKIDMKFIREMDKDIRNKEVVKMVIELSKTLGVKTTAEGVEEENQYLYLKELGCDYIQGYYFSKPLPKDQYIKLLMENKNEH